MRSVPSCLLFLLACAFPAYAQVAQQEVLMQPLGGSANLVASPPLVKVVVDGFSNGEAGTCPSDPYSQIICSYSALDDTFTGQYDANNQTSRLNFRTAIANALSAANVGYTDTLCAAKPSSPSVILYNHSKPYEVQQQNYMTLYHTYSGNTDFMPSGARHLNQYMGNKVCPFVSPGMQPSLAQTFGEMMQFSANGLMITSDNRYNPWRWIAPINEIHAHEQTSTGAFFNSTAAASAATRQILANALTGNMAQRIILYYDVSFSVQDYRSMMGEYSLFNLAGLTASGSDLLSTTYRDFGRYVALTGGPTSSEGAMMTKYWNTRYATPTINLSIGMLFQADSSAWRAAEIMLASFNYAPGWTAPFAPVSDPSWQPYVPEGGNNGFAAWTRTSLAGLTQTRVDQSNKTEMPIRAGGQFVNLPSGDSFTHLVGTIDITDYYRFAVQNRIFPGTSGSWNGVQLSTIVPGTGQLSPSEHHQLMGLGLQYENHGPFGLHIMVNKLDVQIVTPAAQAVMPDYSVVTVGNIDSITNVGGVRYLHGWACTPGRADFATLRVYVGQDYPFGQLLGMGVANQPAEEAVGVACADPLFSPHRFSIPIGTALAASALEGKPIYVKAYSPDGRIGGDLSGSGSILFQ